MIDLMIRFLGMSHIADSRLIGAYDRHPLKRLIDFDRCTPSKFKSTCYGAVFGAEECEKLYGVGCSFGVVPPTAATKLAGILGSTACISQPTKKKRVSSCGGLKILHDIGTIGAERMWT